ncbi:MAG: hypothetical protein NVSMB52_02920 [Chloroflexota bacterium]
MQNIFGFIIHPMEIGIVWLALTVGSAGIGIIIFTIFVRLVLAPLNIAQLRNAKAMQRLQPLMAELKQKHSGDKAKLSEATMGLYREHKVNPAMGCLPMLVQFPILIGLFYALLHLGESPPGYPKLISFAGKNSTSCDGVSIHNLTQWLNRCYATGGTGAHIHHVFDLFHANFLWLSNGLGSPDPLYILPVLAGVTQWIQSRMMLTRSTDPQQQMMNTMMNFMPLMIVFFATRYASGLSLYWVTSTCIGILIQYRITGWGLLPGTVRNMTSIFGGGTLATGRALVSQRTQPKTSSNGQRGSARPVKPAATTKLESDIEMNGNNGSGTESVDSATFVARPRKKANRARGGRGGGRRG